MYRHIGVTDSRDLQAMLQAIGVKSVEELISQVIPASIRLKKPLALPAEGMSENCHIFSDMKIHNNIPCTTNILQRPPHIHCANFIFYDADDL